MKVARGNNALNDEFLHSITTSIHESILSYTAMHYAPAIAYIAYNCVVTCDIDWNAMLPFVYCDVTKAPKNFCINLNVLATWWMANPNGKTECENIGSGFVVDRFGQNEWLN